MSIYNRDTTLEVECVVLSGVPETTIVRYANENHVDLVAISTHGRSGLGRLVFGSVVDYVIRESNLPILVKKPRHIEA